MAMRDDSARRSPDVHLRRATRLAGSRLTSEVDESTGADSSIRTRLETPEPTGSHSSASASAQRRAPDERSTSNVIVNLLDKYMESTFYYSLGRRWAQSPGGAPGHDAFLGRLGGPGLSARELRASW